MVENKDERMWGMLCHLASFCIFIPFGNIIGPVVVWLIKKDEFPFVDDQGKEAVNFNISMTIYGFIAGLLTMVIIGIVLIPIIAIAWLILVIMAAMKANNGEAYRYPFTIRLIK